MGTRAQGHKGTRRGLKSLLLRQEQEELPKPQSRFAEGLRVVTTTRTLRERGVDCRLDFSMIEQDSAMKLIISHQHPYLTTGDLNESFD